MGDSCSAAGALCSAAGALSAPLLDGERTQGGALPTASTVAHVAASTEPAVVPARESTAFSASSAVAASSASSAGTSAAVVVGWSASHIIAPVPTPSLPTPLPKDLGRRRVEVRMVELWIVELWMVGLWIALRVRGCGGPVGGRRGAVGHGRRRRALIVTLVRRIRPSRCRWGWSSLLGRRAGRRLAA